MATTTAPAPLGNLGRFRNNLPGIQGVSSGGSATMNMNSGQRYHRLLISCQAVNYTAPTVSISGAGTYNATLTPVVAQGAITSVTITAAGSGMTNGTYTTAAGQVIITDATGVGAQLSVTIASGAVSAVNVVSGGQPGPANPASVLTSLRQTVNGAVIRDISPAQILSIIVAKGYLPNYGILPILYTDPSQNFIRDNAIKSWDMTGQTNYALQFGISGVATSPNLSGIMEFDYQRNKRTQNGQDVPFLLIENQHSFTIALVAGENIITTIPWKRPTTKLWFAGSTAGAIAKIEVQADNQLAYQGTAQTFSEDAAEYGFQVGSTWSAPFAGGGGGWGNGAPGTGNTVSGTGVKGVPTTIPNGTLTANTFLQGTNLFPFDAAAIFDVDGRPWEALRVNNGLTIRVTSTVAQNLTIIQESLSPGFTG